MRRSMLSFADLVVRSPLVRWTWSGLGEAHFSRVLMEYRPADAETVREMMAGRYLLASRLVDTQGLSPFAIEATQEDWRRELHGFSWLRHFREVADEAERGFARTLTLDWIGRNARFEPRNWGLSVTAVRALNWLRHMPLLVEQATPDQQRTIQRSLNMQFQSLKQRSGLTLDPLDALFSAIALLAGALCAEGGSKTAGARLVRLRSLLDQQIDADGLHKSRNPQVQFELLSELVSVRQALGERLRGPAAAISATIDRMHQALGQMTLGNGEPAYFNGCGQLPVDLVVALQAQSAKPVPASRVLSGYGILAEGAAKVIADSGQVPPPPFGGQAHAGGLSFEFSHGNELVVGNCGPAPADLTENRALFRQGAAHSGPTIDGLSSARLIMRGPLAGSLVSFSGPPEIKVDAGETILEIATSAYVEKFGVRLKRTMTLLSDGDTLVGQDSMLPAGRGVRRGKAVLRFHLAPGAEAEREREEDIIQITLKSGSQWTFLWEGGTAQIDDSVRQSAYFGFYRTRQIVIEANVAPEAEISWIFTRQGG